VSTYESPAITIYDVEREQGWVDWDLDLEYIDAVAYQIALFLADGVPAEAAYQPGDGTFYGLVFTPLRALHSGRPRVVDGVTWDRHAVRGMKNRGGDDSAEHGAAFYDLNGYLLSWLDHACYPIRLGGGRGDLASSYIGEHWRTSPVSAVSIAVLLRAIDYHLDKAAAAAGTPE
jgi:hypothetical protein